jgi:hypothetical protein
VGKDVGDDVGDDVGNRDDGSNDAGNDTSKEDGGNAGEEGGVLLSEDATVAAAAAATAAAAAAAAAAYCWGCFLFIVKIFFCVVFLCVGGIGKVTPPLTLLSCLRYVGILFGGDSNCPQILWYVDTINYLAKKHGNQSWYYFIPEV